MPLESKNTKIKYNNEDDENYSSTFAPVKKQDTKPKIAYNDRSQQSFIKNGLMVPENLDGQQRNFLSKVSVDPKKEHKIRREVTKIVRVKQRDYNSEKLERKEFLYWYENWYGVDWRGAKVPPVTDHIEGYYQELEMEPVINEKGEIVSNKRSGQHKTVYYIPFSKEKVDEIIESSVGTDKDTIIFLFTDGALGYEFPYEEFVNRSYEELVAMLIAPGGPKTILQKQQLEKFLQDQEQIAATLSKTSATKQAQAQKQ